MIDHMGFRVRDLAASRRFYEACIPAIGLQVISNTPESFLIVRSAEDIHLGRHGRTVFLDTRAHDFGQPDTPRVIAIRSIHSTAPRWPLAERTTARLVRAARRK